MGFMEPSTITIAERVFVKENAAMANLCQKQTALYNQAIWYLRQEYFNNDDAGEGFLSYYDLNDKNMLKWKDCYRDAIPGCAANTIQRACDAWKAHWKALKAWSKNSAGFTGKPRMPGYVDRDVKSPVYFTYAQFSIKDHRVVFPSATGFDPIGTRLGDQKQSDSSAPVKQARIIPAKAGGYWVELAYKTSTRQADVDPGRVMGIDLGMTYIATVVDNIGSQPISFKGGDVKSINQLYNKNLAFLKAEHARCNPRLAELQRKRDAGLSDVEWKELRGLLKDTARMKQLAEKRNRRVNIAFHVISKQIVAAAIQRRVGTVVIGHNPGQKQNLDNGRRFNQNFTQLPIFKLVAQITYKAAMNGIEVVEITEEFTSKASAIDNDAIPDRKTTKKKQDGHSDVEFSGKRGPRGLYTSAAGVQIHADVNAAYNIMRKACPASLGTKGAGIRPYPVTRGIPVS